MSRTRRVVTGHEADGRSVIVQDGEVPHVRVLPGATFDEIWATDAAPAPVGPSPGSEPTSAAPAIGPAGAGGTVVRMIDFQPLSAGGVRSPMHRTRTIDYGIVVEGEVVLILSDSETVLRKGDVVVQRGTDHAWENRSDAVATMAFVLIDARFDAELAGMVDVEGLMR
ncbi:cupin domain-containing protein [Tsuneonella sp. HG222]